MSIIKRLEGNIENVFYHFGSNEFSRMEKKGNVFMSSPGTYSQMTEDVNGEVSIDEEFLVEVDFGVRADHSARWVLVDVLPYLHRRFSRLTQFCYDALKATRPSSINVLYHCSKDNFCYYTVDPDDLEQWMDAAEHYLKYVICQTINAFDKEEDL